MSESTNGKSGASADRLHLVFLASVGWEFPLISRQRMLVEAWQRRGQPATFVQVPSYRTAIERLLGRGSSGVVVRPWPTYPSRFWSRVGEGRLQRSIAGRAKSLKRDLDKRVDWESAIALVSSPVWAPWLGELPFRHVVYDCVDDLSVNVPRSELTTLFDRWEDDLLQHTEQAVVTATPLGRDLEERCEGLKATLIQNAVDAEGFEARARATQAPAEIAELARGDRPVVGFVGALFRWVDWGLIASVANANPDYRFVLVGPHDGSPGMESVNGLDNVHVFDKQPYDLVPSIIATFSVAWVPFRLGRIASSANPLKIYEYLSVGKSVVTTPVADVELFGEHVSVGETPDEISAHVRARVEQGIQGKEERIVFAKANSWEQRAEAYLDFVSSFER